MLKIDKYIIQHVLSAIAVVTFMLVGLQIFMLFVSELGAIGQGHYSVFKALIFVLLQLPYHIYLFFPIACLLGVLLGMGMLANHSELLVMRASGVSVGHIAKSLFKILMVLVVVVCLISEWVSPQLVHFSEDWKASLRSGGQTIRTAEGIWLRHQNSFIHIAEAKSNKELLGIHQYQFNKKHQFIRTRYMEKAIYQDGKWFVPNMEQTDLPKKGANKVTTLVKKDQSNVLSLSPSLLIVSEKDPNEMNLWQLGRLILAKKAAHLDPANFEVNFWRRLFQPFSTFVMVLLALPFVFGSTRSRSIGQRFMIGAGAGFLFHLLNEFVVPMSQIFQITPLMAAAIPNICFAMIGMIIVKVMR